MGRNDRERNRRLGRGGGVNGGIGRVGSRGSGIGGREREGKKERHMEGIRGMGEVG